MARMIHTDGPLYVSTELLKNARLEKTNATNFKVRNLVQYASVHMCSVFEVFLPILFETSLHFYEVDRISICNSHVDDN